MASIDIQEQTGPRRDSLGISCFVFHIGVGGFVLGGWLLSSTEALLLYLLVLPVVATQWAINRGSCLINNVETYLRTGRWRDPHCGEDGKFLLIMCGWFFSARPSPQAVDRFSYSVVMLLWLLALGHVSWLTHIQPEYRAYRPYQLELGVVPALLNGKYLLPTQEMPEGQSAFGAWIGAGSNTSAPQA